MLESSDARGHLRQATTAAAQTRHIPITRASLHLLAIKRAALPLGGGAYALGAPEGTNTGAAEVLHLWVGKARWSYFVAFSGLFG